MVGGRCGGGCCSRCCLPAVWLDTGWRWLAQVWDDAVCPAAGVGSYEMENIMSSGQGKFPLEVVTDNALLRSKYESQELGGLTPLMVATTSDGGGFPVAGGAMLNAPALYLRPQINRCTDAHYSTVDNSALNQSFTVVISLPEQFDAIQIGYPHLGSSVGGRGVTGLKALIASTDDAGNGSLDWQTTAGRKFVTPWRDGTEYNSVVSPQGWRAVTWASAASVDIPDAGDKKISIAWSDMIPVEGVEDKSLPGSYPLLVRLYPGNGYYTKVERAGYSAPAKAYAESGISYIAYARKAGDSVTTPTLWDNATTGAVISDIGVPIIIRGYSRRRVRSVMTVGDSRFASVHEDYAGFGYRSCSFLLEKNLRERGLKALRVECCMGGQTTAMYQERALQYLAKIQPDVAVYLVCSINDGNPSAALAAEMRARTLAFIDTCVMAGTMPVLVSAFPSVNDGSNIGAPGVAALKEIDAWTQSLGFPWISPIQIYGNIDTGAWKPGWNYDVYHLTNAGYTDLSARIADLVAPYCVDF